MKNDSERVLIFRQMIDRHQLKISLNQGRIQTSVLGGAIYVGLMGLPEGAILRNPYLSHVNFPVLGGAIAPVALPLDPPLFIDAKF